MHRQILAVFWISILLVAGSFAGSVHGLGDSLAVFRHFWAIGLSISSLLLLRRHVRLALFGVLATGLAVVPMALGYFSRAQETAGQYSIYQKNLLFRGRNQAAIIADILDRSPDFVTLQEVSRTNRVVFETLAETYPSSLFCPFSGVGGVAVLSKWPILDGETTCAGNQGIAAIRLKTPDGPVWLVSLHLYWPFPRRQPEQVAGLLPEFEKLTGPVILAGDFNMVPWSYTLRAIEQATGSQRAGPVVQTFSHRRVPLNLPIDHILVPGGRGVSELLPKLGSDHAGLLLWFNL